MTAMRVIFAAVGLSVALDAVDASHFARSRLSLSRICPTKDTLMTSWSCDNDNNNNNIYNTLAFLNVRGGAYSDEGDDRYYDAREEEEEVEILEDVAELAASATSNKATPSGIDEDTIAEHVSFVETVDGDDEGVETVLEDSGDVTITDEDGVQVTSVSTTVEVDADASSHEIAHAVEEAVEDALDEEAAIDGIASASGRDKLVESISASDIDVPESGTEGAVPDEMKIVLIEELGYRKHEVNAMRPEVAYLVCEKRLERPKEGVPPNWFFEGKVPVKSPEHARMLVKRVALPILVGSAIMGLSWAIGLHPSKVVPFWKKKKAVTMDLNDDYLDIRDEVFADMPLPPAAIPGSTPVTVPTNEHVSGLDELHPHSIHPGDTVVVDETMTTKMNPLSKFLFKLGAPFRVIFRKKG